MRTHFYDLLASSVINPKEELRKLCMLFSGEKRFFAGAYKQISLEEFINREVFRQLSFRGSYLDVADMRKALKLSENDFAFNSASVSLPVETLFLFCEFLLAIGIEGEPKVQENPEFHKQMTTIMENILHLLDRTNHRLENISETETARYIIVEKNKLATEATEVITERPVALAAIEYNHFSLRGDLSRKQAILTALANYVEPILHSNNLKNNGYAQLQSDAGFLLNNFHIRHNNKAGTKQKDYIVSISDKDLESWYDKAYTVMLSVIVAERNIDTSHQLETLKKSYKW